MAIDLTPLRSGGANGGLRIAIFSFLREMQMRFPSRFKFLYLSSTETHAELQEMETEKDQTICLLDRGIPVAGEKKPAILSSRQANKYYRRACVDVFYCPFGDIRRVPSEYPVVAWITDVLHRDYPGTLSREEEEWRESYYGLLAEGADLVQVNSRFTAGSLVKHYGIDSDRIFTTYLAPRKLGSEKAKGSPYFIYPANFWIHKNHETLFVAYAHYLAQAGPSAWDLRLTGNPDVRMDYLQSLSRSLGLESRVHFAGFLPPAEFAAMTAGASALIFPSLYEGFGMPVAESMLLGLPVIASDSGSLPEIGGDACHYVKGNQPLELAGAMLRISTDANYRVWLSTAGREEAKKFSQRETATLLAEQLLKASTEPRDLWVQLRRTKNAGYGRLLLAKNFFRKGLRRLKSALSGT